MIYLKDMPVILQTLVEFDRVAKSNPVRLG
jgi:hypothetical protein